MKKDTTSQDNYLEALEWLKSHDHVSGLIKLHAELKIDVQWVLSKINLNGFSAEGVAHHQNPKIATVLSLSEAVERWTMLNQNIPSSNGMSSHFFTTQAITLAQQELIERDTYLRLHTNQASSKEVYWDHQNLKYLESNGLKVKFIEMEYWVGHKVLLCLFIGKEFKFKRFGVIVSGSYLKGEQTYIKAFYDCLLLLNSVMNDQFKPVSYEDFKNEKKHSIDTHFSLGLNLEYGDRIAEKYLQEISRQKFLLQDKFHNQIFSKTGPFNVVRSSHTDLLPILWDGSSSDHIYS